MAPALRIFAVFLGLGAALAGPAAAATEGHNPSARASGPAEGIEVRLPPDLIFDRTVGESGAVIFRHTTHTTFAGGKCIGCHPQPFKILHPTRRTDHEEMNAGRSCGTCHDGTKAFGVNDTAQCQQCHAPEGASK